MNKKDFIQALGAGVAFGLIVYCFMMIAVHFIDAESEHKEIFIPDLYDLEIDYRVLPQEEVAPVRPMPLPIQPEGADLAMVTFKYEIRVQNTYDDEMLEQTETLDEAVEYITEYSRFHDDLYVYELETGELMLDSATVNETIRSLKTQEQLLIEASQYPETFSEAEIFNLLVD
jgi:hypothetical protein|tara:strand:+ start:16 stop:534 length:519 start_codon:yes stop_codon:yes gene_type:complete